MGDITARHSFDTPLGARIQLLASPQGLEAVYFVLGDDALHDQPTDLTHTAAAQLQEYFSGKRKHFDLPLAPFAQDAPVDGTQRLTVWRTLLDIPYGETCSYSELAHRAGGSPRSVGSANGRNPLCVVVPCHRVIRKDGSLGGYGGPLAPSASAHMLEIKRRLLAHEQTHH